MKFFNQKTKDEHKPVRCSSSQCSFIGKAQRLSVASCLVYLPSLLKELALCWFLEVNPAGLYYLLHISHQKLKNVKTPRGQHDQTIHFILNITPGHREAAKRKKRKGDWPWKRVTFPKLDQIKPQRWWKHLHNGLLGNKTINQRSSVLCKCYMMLHAAWL